MSKEPTPTDSLYRTPMQKFGSIIMFLFTVLMLVAALMQVIWLSCHTVRAVSGASMRPLINNYESETTGDLVILNNNTNVTHGDVIVFSLAENTSSQIEDKQLIKRVIAVAGDNIRFELNATNYSLDVYLNGSKLTEDYVLSVDKSSPDRDAQFNKLVHKYEAFITQNDWLYWKGERADMVRRQADGSITIPSGCMFCMGDNRLDSYDSRNFGPVPVEWCEGIVENVLLRDTFMNYLLSSIYGIQ
ncbi:MAG: signal peptidase I [Clostridia bacterium]|nr:signal peptidase I [Clostridia bacterium]